MTIHPATANYIREHADDDVRQLALQGTKLPEVDLTFALAQIAGRQAACRKLPSWAAVDGIIYPPHLSLEQCSSELTALYKGRVLGAGKSTDFRFVDLTGGFGVDFAFIAQALSHPLSPRSAEGCLLPKECKNTHHLTYVERNEHLCDIARTNFPLLSLEQAEVVCADAEEYLCAMPPADIIYIDPARRNSHGGRTYAISDCTPDVCALRDVLLSKSRLVMVKLSPMLDWRKAVSDLGSEFVREVHIVSVQNECKELLVLMEPAPATTRSKVRLVCANIVKAGELQRFEYSYPLSKATGNYPLSMASGYQPPLPLGDGEGALVCYLYEPNTSIMKAGCFAEVARRYSVAPIAANSHLFAGEQLVGGFPGRVFAVTDVTTLNKRELKSKLGALSQANITVRNFPLSVADLRRRLKLSEGGSTYLFATTLANGDKVIIICRKI